MKIRRKPRTAKEILKELRSDPEWLAHQAEADRSRQAWARVIGEDEARLVEALRQAGLKVDSIWDLFNRKEPWRTDEGLPSYEHVLPLLEEHLARDYTIETKDGIVRALIGERGRGVYEALVKEFRRSGTHAAGEQRIKAEVTLVARALGDLMPISEIERIVRAHWEDYVFILARAVAKHFDRRRDLPEIVSLLEDDGLTEEHRRELATWVAARANRWKEVPPELQRALARLLPPDQVPRRRT